MNRAIALLACLLLAACGNAVEPPPAVIPTATPTATQTPVNNTLPTPTELSIPTFYLIPTPEPTSSPHPDWLQVFAQLSSADVVNTCYYWLSFWSERGSEMEELAEFIAWHPGIAGQQLLPTRWEGLSATLVYSELRYDLPMMSPVFHQVADECSEQAPRGFLSRLDRINEDLRRFL